MKPFKSAACGLALAMVALAGCSSASGEAASEPAEDWSRFWLADPFANTVRLEIKHLRAGGKGETYVIDERQALNQLISQAKITGIMNDASLACEASAQLDFVKQDGSRFSVSMICEQTYSVETGTLYLAPAFAQALNAHLSKVAEKPVNLAESLPEEPVAESQQKLYAAPSLEALKTGLARVELNYPLGEKQLHGARITEPADLAELHQALKVISQDVKALQDAKAVFRKSDQSPKARNRISLTLFTTNGARMNGVLLHPEELFVFDVGLLKIEASFAKKLSEIVSRMESRPIDVLAQNELDAKQQRRLEDFRKLIDGATGIRFASRKDNRPITINDPKQVAELLTKMEKIEVPLHALERPATGRKVSVTTKDGRELEIVFFDSGDANHDVPIAPLVGDLVNVQGFGQIWISNQWKYQFGTYEYKLQQGVEERRKLETTKAVCRDLPRFLDQVMSVEIGYSEGEQRAKSVVPAESVRRLLKQLRIERVEPLTWSPKEWTKRLAKLEAEGAAALTLTPGLGFDLMIIESGPKELLIPPYGRAEVAKGRLADFPQRVSKDAKKWNVSRRPL